MEFGVHLPQLEIAVPPAAARVAATVDAARDLGFCAVSVNDHFTFRRRWIDGLTLLAAVAGRAGGMDLMTTVALPTLRGPIAYAAAMSALATMTEGRVIAGIGPGSSRADYELFGASWQERWQLFDEAARLLQQLFAGPESPPLTPGKAMQQPSSIIPGQAIELWLGSWGSPAGLRRVARYGDGWLASAYHGTATDFGRALGVLHTELQRAGRSIEGFGHAVVTMWTWVTDDSAESSRMLNLLADALGREPSSLAGRVCVGTPEHCVQLLTAYAEQGCRRVNLWPLADEPAQLRRFTREVMPRLPS